MKQVAWSHSALSAYETCPRRYYLVKVTKEVSDPPGEALSYGLEVHKAFEYRLKDGTPLPQHLAKFEGVASGLLRRPGDLLVEQQWAIDASFRQVPWFSKDTWCRAVVDAGKLHRTSMVLLDWKTGQRKPDSDQLKLSAGMAFAVYPEVQTVSTGFAWVGIGKLDPEVFHRSQVGDIWGTFLPRVARLEQAFRTGKWEPRPSGLCRNYCPVPKTLCEFRP